MRECNICKWASFSTDSPSIMYCANPAGHEFLLCDTARGKNNICGPEGDLFKDAPKYYSTGVPITVATTEWNPAFDPTRRDP